MNDLRRRFLAAYHAAVDHLTKEEKIEMRETYLKWNAEYDKQNAKTVKEAGDLYKVMLQARLEFEELVRLFPSS